MNRYLKEFIGDMLDFTIENEYLFHELYGFTLVFRKDITFLNDQLTSAEILPVGMIYEENGEFYYATLHDNDEIDEIVKEFVKTKTKN